jgi:nucleoid-associated protein YgaU
MQRDFKIGMFVGLVLVIGAAIWLATRPSLSPRARILRAHDNTSAQESALWPDSPVIAGRPAPVFADGQPGNLPTPSREFTAEGVGNKQSEAPDFTVYEQKEKIRTQRFHIVRDGENLSAISLRYYGSANKWAKILAANRSVVKDPDKITPGTKLIIPD